MGLFSRLIGRKSAGTTYGTLELWRELFGGGAAKSGPVVNWYTALQVTTTLACTRRIAEGVATVPLKVYRRDPVTGKREEARDHPLYDLLGSAPNEWQTSLEFRETLTFHAALTGNAFAFINRVRGRVVELIPLDPKWVQVERQVDNALIYRVSHPEGGTETFPAEVIWHVRGPSWDSWMGLDAVKLAREALGLALSTEETHAKMHANGVRPSGLLSVEGVLEPDGMVRLAAWVKKHHGGAENSSRVMVVDRNSKFIPFQMTGVDAQHLETRRFQIEEICRGLGVMPIMVGYYDKAATYASAEQMFLAHMVHTVRPWHRRFEQSGDKHLLSAEERADGYYLGFLDTELLRGDAKTRAEYYKLGIESGWMLRNEARGYEEMPPVDGLDRPLVPANINVIGPDGLPIPVAKPKQGGGQETGRPFVGDEGKGYNPAQPRGRDGRWIPAGGAGRRQVRAFVRQVLATPGDHALLSLGMVQNATVVTAAGGPDVTGYRRVMDNSGTRHAWKQHSDPAREAARQPPQVAITKRDFERVPQIVAAAHVVKFTKGSGSRASSIEYRARLGRYEYGYIEQIRSHRRDLALHSLFKK